MKTINAPMLNRPPILVSNQRHPPLLLFHLAAYLLNLIFFHHLDPDAEIRSYKPFMPYLDVETRGRLVGMRQAGLSFRAIAEWNNLPLTTVYNTFQKYEQIGTVTTQQKSGRPTKLTERDRRQLSRIITRCRRLTVAQVTSLMTSHVSNRTIQREIHKLGKHSRIAPKKPYLRPQDFQRRLAFAQAHRHWTINEWAKVIWTDESAFELGKRVDQVRVWRTANEKWLLENLAVNHRSGRQSVMIWGGFCAAHRSSIVFLDGRMNSQEMVRQVYRPALRPFVEQMEQAPWIRGRHRLLLMEDNAPIHTAAVSNQWRERNGILKMEWPAHSPDLNPIENIWKSMKSQISKLYQPQNLEELKHAIRSCWSDIHPGILNDYLRSMPRRMQMVIDQRGGPTSY
ncbi:hypothetical protein O181_070552 [Austropuccinia psidii MF-1]|uniref:Tc1-like transposase DDE domain-containing protein n=1 Tax=Austropuccinia psidii MF-1 TaxID=1389203 RepID=A0A9Q3F647_9BASI|nr:hypothetical protein [Austropuccinia psidii MF-1]